MYTKKVDIITLSLSAELSPEDKNPLKRVVAKAIRKGIVVIAAAGNSNSNINNVVPAGCDGVITVAASGKYDNIPYWSNHGLTTSDYTAPGRNIVHLDRRFL